MRRDLFHASIKGSQAAKKGKERSRYPETPVEYQNCPAIPLYFKHSHDLLTKVKVKNCQKSSFGHNQAISNVQK